MSLPVTIENDAIRLEVYPQFGGKILSIVDKADEYELLFDYPAEFPTTCQYDQPYQKGYYAGWDECFPAVGPGPYPSHPYKGISVPDHGELWALPTTVVPSRDGFTTEWNGLRFGYRLSRKLSLEGPSIIVEYSLQNLAPFELQFVWAMHSLMSLHSPVELEMGAGAYRLSHDHQIQRIDAPFEWPVTAAGEDLSLPDGLPQKRGWKIFSAERIQKPAVVRYPVRKRMLKIEYSSDDGMPAYWGVWINTGGWVTHRHFALEPTTGRFDEIDRASKDGSAGRAPISGKIGWRVRWTLG
ncbi:MAG TPA: hypothetical protein VH518_08590 [Tepidisphaeraceae bacterium]|jgi:hypothetical protein